MGYVLCSGTNGYIRKIRLYRSFKFSEVCWTRGVQTKTLAGIWILAVSVTPQGVFCVSFVFHLSRNNCHFEMNKALLLKTQFLDPLLGQRAPILRISASRALRAHGKPALGLDPTLLAKLMHIEDPTWLEFTSLHFIVIFRCIGFVFVESKKNYAVYQKRFPPKKTSNIIIWPRVRTTRGMRSISPPYFLNIANLRTGINTAHPHPLTKDV